MESPSASVDRDQMSLQQRTLRVDTAALCDDVENVVGDVLCDGFDELEGILGAEETVPIAPEQIREVRSADTRHHPRLPGGPLATRAAPRLPPRTCLWLTPTARSLRTQGVDAVMYKFQKHAVDNCRVFKTYSLQHIFAISPEVAQRVRQPEDRVPAATPGAHAAAEEAAIDAELAQLRERANSVGPASSECHSVGS